MPETAQWLLVALGIAFMLWLAAGRRLADERETVGEPRRRRRPRRLRWRPRRRALPRRRVAAHRVKRRSVRRRVIAGPSAPRPPALAPHTPASLRQPVAPPVRMPLSTSVGSGTIHVHIQFGAGGGSQQVKRRTTAEHALGAPKEG